MKLRSIPLLILLAVLALASIGAPSVLAETATKPPAETAPEKDADSDKESSSAADRRAEASKFEREKLDQAAFDDAEKDGSSAEKDSESGNAGSIMRALFGLVVVLGAIYAVHYLLKKWGSSRMQGAVGRGGVIDVVATTPLAQGRSLHLVRVGTEIVLVGATEQSITRLGEVDVSVLGAAAADRGNPEFQSALSGAMFSSQQGIPAGMTGAGTTQDPFMKRFLDNLRMTTAR